MCGGRGRRFDADVEKPLYPVGGTPMVDRVRDALAASRVRATYAVVSPDAPATRAHLANQPTIETPGEGYVPDLRAALTDERVDGPVLTVAADLPLLDGAAVDAVLNVHERGSLTVVVPVARKQQLGVSIDEPMRSAGEALVPAGLNVVGEGDERRHVTDDPRLAVNVNRLADARRAEALL